MTGVERLQPTLDAPAKRTIVLIHGAWMTGSCWDKFKARYESSGYRCIAPAWPYDERPVEDLRRAPSRELAGVGITEIVDHYARMIGRLDAAPLLIGHSFGGLFVQMLLDRGLGAAGVAIDSAPPKGVLPGLDPIRAGFPVLRTWRGWKKILTLSYKSFQWGWVHTLPEADQRVAYERYVVPTPGRVFFQAAFAPFGSSTRVNVKNNARAPLLLIAGELDRTVETRMNRANFKQYGKSSAVTAFKEFPGRTHWLIAAPGWEEVADYALEWAEARAARG
ncbi:MAG: alpha/beta hydrolase [Chloroflexota bacterium]|nr:alpha/beta hydrolase [Chloroflexota bacterium]